jgi:hypothetical protein
MVEGKAVVRRDLTVGDDLNMSQHSLTTRKFDRLPFHRDSDLYSY